MDQQVSLTAPSDDQSSARPAKANEFRQRVAAEMIAQVIAGTAPWQKPWDPSMGNDVPINAVTKQPYRGGNAFWLEAMKPRDAGDDPRWVTYKQAAEQGWQVKKGAHGVGVEFWATATRQKSDEQIDRERERFRENGAKQNGRTVEPTAESTHLVHRTYAVFHASQVDGIPPHVPEPVQPKYEVAEDVARAVGAKVEIGSARAYYTPATDMIRVPPRGAFNETPGGFESTLLHEAAHATGHESRLNRDIVNKFGTQDYAREELRAEMASAILSREMGVPYDPSQHASYAANWVKTLQNDPNELFRAAADAQRIAGWMVENARQKGVDVDLPEHSRIQAPAKAVVEKAVDHERERREVILGEQGARKWTGRVVEIAEDRTSVTMRALGQETIVKMPEGQQVPEELKPGAYGKLIPGRDGAPPKFEVEGIKLGKGRAKSNEVER